MTELHPDDRSGTPPEPSAETTGAPAAEDAGSTARRLSRHPLVRYVLIGGLCFVIDAGLLWFCTSVLGWEVWLGATVGYWTGLLVNFTLNRTTMSQQSGRLLRQTSRYAALLAANYLITLLVLHVTAAWWPAVVAKTVIVAASTCWNYVLYRTWVFA